MTHICVLFTLLGALSSAHGVYYTVESENDLPVDYPVTLSGPFIRFDMNNANSNQKHNMGLIYLFNQRFLHFRIIGQPGSQPQSLSLHFKTLTLDVSLADNKCNDGDFVHGAADFAINFEKNIMKCGANVGKQVFIGGAGGIDFVDDKKILEVGVSWDVVDTMTLSISKNRVAFPSQVRPLATTATPVEESEKDDDDGSFESSSLSLWIIVIVSVWTAIALVGLVVGIIVFSLRRFRKDSLPDTVSTKKSEMKATKEDDENYDGSQT